MSPEAGLYVHVPFCSALCPYCDFAVNVAPERRRSRYVDLLLLEISLRGRPRERFDTLFFGGGTPSVLPASELRRIVGHLSAAGWLYPECRIFLEANPEDVSEGKLRDLRQAGVSTLSLGVQSLDPERLRALGRRHGREEAQRAIALAREAGFETVSVDLIYGAPGETASRLQKDLEDAVGLGPDHLSCYQLTVHETTLFGRRKSEGRLDECSDEMQASFFRLTHQLLEGFGYEAYEVSNFARTPEHRSRHNQKYWMHAPYLGLGPSAHSFDGHSRAWNERSFFAWERRLLRGEVPIAGREELQDEDLLLETLMLRLRTPEGVDLEEIEKRFGIDVLDGNRELVLKALEDGLLVQEGQRLRPTLDGLAVADGLASRFRIWLRAAPQSVLPDRA
jgi:oxygen-independent coproporphyrinogen-3 oxidase